MKTLLAIDTSTELASIALSIDDKIMCEKQEGIRQHAMTLLPMLERLLATAQLSLSQLDGIVFGAGPGSFTGLRIACSIAKALAFAHDLPLFPVSSLAAIATTVQQTTAIQEINTQILAVIDARMHQLYWANMSLTDALQLAQPALHVDAAQDIVLAHAGPCILAGVGFTPYLPLLPPTTRTAIIAEQTIFPEASALLAVAKTGAILPCNANEALPFYIRNQVTQGEVRG